MKSNLMFYAFFFFLSICFSSLLSKEETECASENGLTQMTNSDIFWHVRCPSDATKEFKDFVICVLKKGSVLTPEGKLNEQHFNKVEDYTFNLLRTLESINSTYLHDNYALTIYKIIFQSKFHKLPSHCKNGYLNEEWNLCRKQNLILPTKYEDVVNKASQLYSNPSDRYKKFILCGLKAENIIKENGQLNLPIIKISSVYGKVLDKLTEIQLEDENIPDYAWKIFKILIRTQTGYEN